MTKVSAKCEVIKGTRTEEALTLETGLNDASTKSEKIVTRGIDSYTHKRDERS